MADVNKKQKGGLGLFGVAVVMGLCVSWWKLMGFGFESMPWWGVWAPALVALAVNLLVAIGVWLAVKTMER